MDAGATSSIDPLDYEIPDSLRGRIGIGSSVLVPLGTRQAVGYVIGTSETTAVARTRPIIADIDSPVRLTDDLFELAQWISARYLCPLARVVSGMLPGVMHCRVRAEDVVENSVATRVWRLIPPEGKPRVLRGVRIAPGALVDEHTISSLPPKQARALEIVRSLGRDCSLLELSASHGVTQSPLAALRKKGLLETVDITLRRVPAFARVEQRRHVLNDQQRQAVERICASIDAGSYRGHLLFGVTASGKTEVYLRCIERALQLGRTSLVLLPEIALTTQVMNIFKTRFGQQVAVLHSALSAGERCDEWTRVTCGEAKVVLGARSAVFAPVENLGLVVVDEEHESSYKQDTHPRYHGREVAAQRARQSGAALVLGSATPSVETFYAAQQGEYELLTLSARVEDRAMPRVHVADLRSPASAPAAEEKPAATRPTIFSDILEQRIRDRLARGEQVMLLQNRRAFSTFLLCRDCGFVMRCPNCAVSLKLHTSLSPPLSRGEDRTFPRAGARTRGGARALTCHHCDYSRPAPTVCPSCGGERMKGFGIGTQRVEDETRRAFPEARILRMDRDTTSRRGAHAAILNAFRSGETDILIGTQMIAKGLDFPNVTLVGIISADTSLNLPDFRASERTLQLISQVAGRSGRGTQPGEVVIQTFDPDHYAIRSAVDHDYPGFYRRELEERRDVRYPPFASLVNVIAKDPVSEVASRRLEGFAQALRREPMSARRGIEIIGPAPAVLSRLRGEYRWHLVLRSTDRDSMLSLLRTVLDRTSSWRKHLTVDVDPVSML